MSGGPAAEDRATHARAVVLMQHSEVWAGPQNCPLTNQRLKARKLFCCNFMKQPNRDEHMSDLRRCLAAVKACGTFGLRTELALTTSVASDFSAAFHLMNASGSRNGASGPLRAFADRDVGLVETWEGVAMGRRRCGEADTTMGLVRLLNGTLRVDHSEMAAALTAT